MTACDICGQPAPMIICSREVTLYRCYDHEYTTAPTDDGCGKGADCGGRCFT